MLYAILIILLVIFILLFVLPGVIVFFLLKSNVIKSNNFTETFNSIMEKMMSGMHIDTKQTSSNISYGEALEMFDLEGNPNSSQVNKAYHKLMQSNHPDKGGSSYLAKKINLARDVLLKKSK